MDIKNTADFPVQRELQFDKNILGKYDYASGGVLTKCLPKVLFRGNPVLVTFLQLIDMRIILMLKAVDKIKYFKDILRY